MRTMEFDKMVAGLGCKKAEGRAEMSSREPWQKGGTDGGHR